VIMASFFLDPIWWLFVGWLPIYLSRTYGFGVAEIGVYAWVPYVGAMFGAWFGGLLAQNRIKAGWTVNKTRKSVIALGGLIMLVSLLMTIQAATPLAAQRFLQRSIRRHTRRVCRDGCQTGCRWTEFPDPGDNGRQLCACLCRWRWAGNHDRRFGVHTMPEHQAAEPQNTLVRLARPTLRGPKNK
jgi:hypothetical protein